MDWEGRPSQVRAAADPLCRGGSATLGSAEDRPHGGGGGGPAGSTLLASQAAALPALTVQLSCGLKYINLDVCPSDARVDEFAEVDWSAR